MDDGDEGGDEGDEAGGDAGGGEDPSRGAFELSVEIPSEDFEIRPNDLEIPLDALEILPDMDETLPREGEETVFAAVTTRESAPRPVSDEPAPTSPELIGRLVASPPTGADPTLGAMASPPTGGLPNKGGVRVRFSQDGNLPDGQVLSGGQDHTEGAGATEEGVLTEGGLQSPPRPPHPPTPLPSSHGEDGVPTEGPLTEGAPRTELGPPTPGGRRSSAGASRFQPKARRQSLARSRSSVASSAVSPALREALETAAAGVPQERFGRATHLSASSQPSPSYSVSADDEVTVYLRQALDDLAQWGEMGSVSDARAGDAHGDRHALAHSATVHDAVRPRIRLSPTGRLRGAAANTAGPSAAQRNHVVDNRGGRAFGRGSVPDGFRADGVWRP